ncbi:hypothetical protein Droror1_Dr00016025 [Drosera rotundifolia]
MTPMRKHAGQWVLALDARHIEECITATNTKTGGHWWRRADAVADTDGGGGSRRRRRWQQTVNGGGDCGYSDSDGR